MNRRNFIKSCGEVVGVLTGLCVFPFNFWKPKKNPDVSPTPKIKKSEYPMLENLNEYEIYAKRWFEEQKQKRNA